MHFTKFIQPGAPHLYALLYFSLLESLHLWRLITQERTYLLFYLQIRSEEHLICKFCKSVISKLFLIFLPFSHSLSHSLSFFLNFIQFQVHILTRICSAVFGVAIIGCGVPIFCVIIKTSLYSNRTCNGRWSFFWYVP